MDFDRNAVELLHSNCSGMIDLRLNDSAAEQVGVLPHLTEASKKTLNARAVEQVLPMWQMTLGQLIAFNGGDFSSVISDEKKMTLAEFVWLSQYPNWIEEFSKVVGALNCPTTAEQRQAANACLPVEWKEGMLIFARRYFGLKSFDEAEGVKVCDFVLAKKDEYNAAMFERAMSEQRKRAAQAQRR